VIGFALGLAGSPAGLHAQVSTELVDRGVRAYGDVDFDAAVGFLRRWLAAPDAPRAALDDRRRALTYLGAAEALRGRGDSAHSAFERLVALDPRYRIDELLFPPEVSTLFAQVRQRTKAVAVEADREAEIVAEGGAYTVRAYASSAHAIRAVVRHPDGRASRALYTGFIGDSLDLRWDGRDSTGALVTSGSYYLEIQSVAVLGDAVTRVLQLPLEITVERPDTLLHPPAPADSVRITQRTPAGPGVEALAGGTLAGAAAALLPALLAPGADFQAARFVVAGVLGGAGVIGFVRVLPGRPLAASQPADSVTLAQWRSQVAAVTGENRARRARARITVRRGEVTVADLRSGAR
jgi:hypothetical protein